METVEYMWVNIPCMLSALQKSWSTRGASHHPAFMGNCWIICHTFDSLIYPVDGGNEDVGRSLRQHLIVFFFRANQVHCFSLKLRARGEYLMCIVSAKIRELGGRFKCQQGDTS